MVEMSSDEVMMLEGSSEEAGRIVVMSVLGVVVGVPALVSSAVVIS
jgi:predicted RND superfamily exporter protein